MAKRSRTPTRRAVARKRPEPRKVAPTKTKSSVGQKTKQRSAPAPARQAPLPRTSYANAILAYEQGLAAIQKKQYRLAAETLRSVLELYPEEKELHERVRLYLRVCERQTDPVDSTARSPEEQVYAATLAVNAGSYDKAIELAADALRSNSDLDNAEYILAVALTLKGDLASAAVRLKQAIDLNHENRELPEEMPISSLFDGLMKSRRCWPAVRRHRSAGIGGR
jgi:tetratricopeptide (TPR) repeat protein